jgi:hypothetical protein
LPDRDSVIEPINFGDRSGARLLGPNNRARDSKGGDANEDDPCDPHGILPLLEDMSDKPRGADWFLSVGSVP